MFGTAQPLKGLSGASARYAYARFSEGRAAHWLLLVAADRVDAWESHLRSFATLRPDNPVTRDRRAQRAAPARHRAPAGSGRVDRVHQAARPGGRRRPWVLAGAGATVAVRRLARAVRR